MSPETTRLAPALRLPLSLCLALALIAAPAWAQTITGRIDGRVTDSSDAVLPGATVTIVNANTGFTVNLPTDANGVYTANNLPVGTYTVTVELQGFRRAQRTGLQLGADGRLTADFALGVGELTESVQVQAVDRRGREPDQRRGRAHHRLAADPRPRLQRPQLPGARLADSGRGRHRLRSARARHVAERHRTGHQRQPPQHQQPHHRRHVEPGLRLERLAGQQRQPQLHRRGEDPDVELLRRGRPQHRRRRQRGHPQRHQPASRDGPLRPPRREVRQAELLRRARRQRQQGQATARVPQLRGRAGRAADPQPALLLRRPAVPHHQPLHQPDAPDAADDGRAERRLLVSAARRRRPGRHRRRRRAPRPGQQPAVCRQRHSAEPDHDRRPGDRQHLPVDDRRRGGVQSTRRRPTTRPSSRTTRSSRGRTSSASTSRPRRSSASTAATCTTSTT